eukprot:6361942-Alexandrium_andersonii.AAC.1
MRVRPATRGAIISVATAMLHVSTHAEHYVAEQLRARVHVDVQAHALAPFLKGFLAYRHVG